jgi:hypothetical protein
MKGVLLAALVAVLASVALPHGASAEPQPGTKKKGFRLFARALGAMTINRIYCGLASDGQVCVDSTNSSTIGGGFWPKGTPDQYIFNSGLQVAGVIGPDGGPWAGDTVGGFFFDPKGTTQHGEEVQPIYNAANPSDLAAWPESACVPFGDASAALFDPLLTTDPTNDDPAYSYKCRKSASQGDVWWVSWDGNPSLRAGRKHPIGVLVETRGMGWNFPAGNEDILYFIYTFYNVSSTNAADYAAYRPSIRSILLQKASDFHSAVAATGVNLPAAGYTMTNLFAAFARDDDVANAGSNYASVNLPFALGFTYDHSFAAPPDWKFDPSLFSSPFFPGAGFTGAKYLKSPTGAGAIQLFSNTINGQPFAGAVNDPRDVVQLYRYLSGTLSPAFGDQPCNNGNPAATRICFVNNTSPQDMRIFQSSSPLSLGPGESGSIVVAYIFAAPVKTDGCGTTCDVKPGNAQLTNDVVNLPLGANLVDSLTGFRGFRDLNGDNEVQQTEMTVVPGSLLGKSLVAQSVFDNRFLLPFAPSGPEFFLIPGDNQVTILWKPSASEGTGDPFFAIANAPQVTDPVTSALVANALYDPNYREFDVEGYRIYRGRVDAPNEMTLLAQFDYAGTVISDFTGVLNPSAGCAPEFGIDPTCPATTPTGAGFSPNRKDGTTLTEHVDYDLVGTITQVNAGSGRTPLAVGRIDTIITAIDSTVTPPDTTFTTVFIPTQAQVLKADTLLTGGGSNGACGPRQACPALSNTGVPFVFIDRTPRNNFRYFYSVTAFDVNSIESGPTSLESPRTTKSVRPVRPSSNFTSSGALTTQVFGRGAAANRVTVDPTIDGTTGIFSGPALPADGTTLAFAGELASAVVGQSGLLSAKLDSLKMGQADLSGCCGGGREGIPARYYWRVFTATDTFTFNYAVQQDFDVVGTDNRFFNVLNIDSTLADKYGGDKSFVLYGQQVVNATQSSYLGGWGLGFALGAAGLGANDRYNGYRWFDGPWPTKNETQANPTAGNCGTGIGACASTTSFNNAGKLTNVVTVYQPRDYVMIDREWRNVSQSLSSAVRAADFNVYWGAGGVVDSVIDVTHNVEVRFDSSGVLTSGYAFLNVAGQAATGSFDGRTGVVTLLDWTCVEPLRSQLTQPDNLFYPCTSAAPFTISAVAVPGPIALGAGSQQSTSAPQSVRTALPAPGNVQPNNGISMYLAGTITFFELSGGALPAANTVWTLRTYAGSVRGGRGGQAGNLGNYTFIRAPRPFTAVGAELRVSYDVTNELRAARFADLKQVHTVPDPYYVTSEYEQTTDTKIIKFVNLPDKAIIRIYSSSGVLVNLLENPGPSCSNVNVTTGKADNATGGECIWNVRNRNNQVVASGVYFYHVEANTQGGTARRVGRMTIVNFAQ